MRRWLLLATLLASGCAHTAPRSSSMETPKASAAAEARESYGWTLLSRRCQGCHALPDPRTHSRERWVRGIETMRRRFTLAPADWDTLLAMVPADPPATTP